MRTRIAAFFKNEDGATAIEYGLIAALITVAVIASIVAVGNNVAALWNTSAANTIANQTTKIR